MDGGGERERKKGKEMKRIKGRRDGTKGRKDGGGGGGSIEIEFPGREWVKGAGPALASLADCHACAVSVSHRPARSTSRKPSHLSEPAAYDRSLAESRWTLLDNLRV